MENIIAPQKIEKEEIVNLKFPDSEVLQSADSKKKRLRDLEMALTLGNLERGKIAIVFEDNNSVKRVDTTVWGLTDSRVILKMGIVLPIHRILEVKI